MKKTPDTHDYTLLRAKFDARLVGRVAPFVAKADIRYYLCGICVEAAGDRPGVYVVGCDGHQLMVAYDPQGMIENDDGHGIILAMPPAFVRACATQRKGGMPLDVLITGRRVSVAPGWGGMWSGDEIYVMPGVPFVPGRFPLWRKVLPDFSKLKPGMTNEVQAPYLARYAQAVKGSKWGGAAVKLWQERHDGPVVVQFPSYPELVSVLMPMRDTWPAEEGLKRLQTVVDTRREEAT